MGLGFYFFLNGKTSQRARFLCWKGLIEAWEIRLRYVSREFFIYSDIVILSTILFNSGTTIKPVGIESHRSTRK